MKTDEAKEIYTLEEALSYIQKLEYKAKIFDQINVLFQEVRYGGIDEFDFSDQVLAMLGEC